MSVETIGNLQHILNNHQSRSWTKAAEILTPDVKEAFNFPTGALSFTDDNKKSFFEMLSDSLANVNNLQVQADEAVQRLATGQTKNIHETMLAVERAEIAFKTMNQVRTKVLDAYKQIMNMQI